MVGAACEFTWRRRFRRSNGCARPPRIRRAALVQEPSRCGKRQGDGGFHSQCRTRGAGLRSSLQRRREVLPFRRRDAATGTSSVRPYEPSDEGRTSSLCRRAGDGGRRPRGQLGSWTATAGTVGIVERDRPAVVGSIAVDGTSLPKGAGKPHVVRRPDFETAIEED